ncbi:hypothetical protein [Commensalibacter oyaizuii]|uniref:Uncharacterized protein n=1 Tax=Commensalibacter oyaizuii TaxID=3043873 RepID=A0ABT6Q2V1_9PROT|nr:hypothetical protein [Commensalibacter sp. TBRC 16381]MDI2090896.1 hypothetical protein [Commensalibacter sp. TBRC 16381]
MKKGLKVLIDAHHAIVKLVKGVFIKVIITTNFNRLLEQALQARGITPVVIASENDLKGQKSLDHVSCFLFSVTQYNYIDF